MRKINNTTVPIKIELKNITKTWINANYGGWFEYTYDIFLNGKKIKHMEKDNEINNINHLKTQIKDLISDSIYYW